MVRKYAIIGLISSVLIFTWAHAQDWRNSSLKSKAANDWRKKPYTTGTSDNWRKSGLRLNDSQLRWNKNKWGKSKIYWRNSSTRWNKKKWEGSPLNWRNSPNRWNKEKWRHNPLNWRNADLEWKNSRKRYESGSTKQDIKKWGSPQVQTPPNDTEEKKEEAKTEEDLKPQIVTITADENSSEGSITETTKHLSSKDNSIVIYSSEGVKLLKQSEPITKKYDDGTTVIYGSNSGN